MQINAWYTFWGISCEKSRFYAKKSYYYRLRREARKFLRYFVWKITILRHKIIFFPILGGGGRAGCAPLWIRTWCNLMSHRKWSCNAQLEIIRFFGVKSWFFTRNTPTIFAPPSAIGNNKIFWRKIVIFHTKYPNNFRASLWVIIAYRQMSHFSAISWREHVKY
jgi:hypothetical protein